MLSYRVRNDSQPSPSSQRRRPRRQGLLRPALVMAAGLLLNPATLSTTVAQNTPAASPIDTTGNPKAIIQSALDQALAVLRNESYKSDPTVRAAKVRAVVDQVFDWEAMAKSSIGPQWRKLKQAERDAFIKVFQELLARQYMGDIMRFQGDEKLAVIGDDSTSGIAKVKTVLTTLSNETIPIDYTLHQAGGRWLVEDVSIEGVSMVNHYRNSFSRFLVNNEFSALLQRLERSLGAH